MWRALGLALVACLYLAAPAHADIDYVVERWERVVGYRPCHGDIDEAAHRFRTSAWAHVHVGDCAVHWNADKLSLIRALGAEWVCSIRAHEVGHLAGWDHSDNERSIMAPILRRPYRWCSLTRP